MKKLLLLLAFTISINFSNAQWTQTSAPYGAYCIAINGAKIFAGTDNGVYVSLNDGTDWAPDTVGMGSKGISSIAVSGNNIYAGWIGGIYVSTNNGGSWVLDTTGMGDKGVNSIALEGNNVYAGNDGAGVYLSIDSGSHWTVNTGLADPRVLSLTVSETTVFAGTLDGGLYLSTDTGKNWSPNYINGIGNYIPSLGTFGTTVFAGVRTIGGFGELTVGEFYSANAGSLWSQGVLDNYLYHTSMTSSGSTVFIGAWYDYCCFPQIHTGHGVYLSSDTGKTWSAANEGFTDSSVTALATNANYIFAGTTGTILGSGVWRRALSDVITAVKETPDTKDFSVYPNPAKNKLRIQNTEFRTGSIKIYSTVGQMLYQATITNPQSEIDVSKLSSGVYFLQLKSESGSVVKKFVKE